jgi:hypothetical protein
VIIHAIILANSDRRSIEGFWRHFPFALHSGGYCFWTGLDQWWTMPDNVERFIRGETL